MLGHLPCETNNADKWKTPINNINNNKEKFIEQNWMIKLIACTNHWILNGSTITLVLSCITISHINQYCKCAQRAKHWQNDLAWDTLYIYMFTTKTHQRSCRSFQYNWHYIAFIMCSTCIIACLHCGTFLYRGLHTEEEPCLTLMATPK